jgi:hypothetical protein
MHQTWVWLVLLQPRRQQLQQPLALWPPQTLGLKPLELIGQTLLAKERSPAALPASALDPSTDPTVVLPTKQSRGGCELQASPMQLG